MHHRLVMRHRLVIFAVLAISFAAAAAALLRAQPAAFDPASDLASICTLETPFAPEVLGEARHRFEVAVPAINPLPGRADARTFVVVRGDVIQVRVDAPPRGGFVAVHGILEEHRVKPSGSIYVKLQAKYSGRFPLHFHGADGSHFEVAVFEVRPEP